MKSSELHKLIKKNGWSYSVPFHGTKEIGKGIEHKIRKEMGLNNSKL